MKHIYVNGKVYTGELPLVQAFGEEEGKFVFAGSDEEAAALAEPGDKVTESTWKRIRSTDARKA